MRFWARELAGWLLVLGGLYAMYYCFALMLQHAVFEAGALSVIGIMIFRGGVHLLKVAIAARVCMEARRGEEANVPTERRSVPARPSFTPRQ